MLIISLNHYYSPMGYGPHFTNEETEAQKSIYLIEKQ